MVYKQMLNYHLITSHSELISLAKILNDKKAVGVDLEADSMYHFQEKVCLIQMATEQQVYILDPFQLNDLSPLKSLFSNDQVRKIFHGADYDVRCLYRDFGIDIHHLFDTQIAAMFLGIRETGLNALIRNRFNVELKKKYQKKNWSIRPLPEDMLTYAAMDVLYLLPLARQLEDELSANNRSYWVDEETVLLSKVRPATDSHRPLFLKIKGAGKLSPRSLAVLESLLSFRKRVAKRRDRPLFKILSNASLLKIASIIPSDETELVQSGILSAKQIAMYGRGLIKAIDRAKRITEDKLPAYPHQKPFALRKGVSKKIRNLKSWRDNRAQMLELEPSLICNNTLISAIAVKNPKRLTDLKRIPGMRKWQIQEFGEDILRIINH